MIAPAPTITQARPSSIDVPASPLKFGPPVGDKAFSRIRRHMMLECCKWDPQVGDVATMSPSPLIVERTAWSEVAELAESLAAELSAAERELLGCPELWPMLAIPRKLRRAIRPERGVCEKTVRVLRFDFHWTEIGWQVSEVNSDVPGGYAEGSNFPRLMAREFPGVQTVGDPAAAWADAFAESVKSRAAAPEVALLAAAGFMEDQQVVRYLARLLTERGCVAHFADFASLRWSGGNSFLNRAGVMTALSGIVRFYQAEWLTKLPRAAWQPLFGDPHITVTNPASAILTESKRLPLVWDKLNVAMPTWRTLLPETRDPREVNLNDGKHWLLKSAFCNTGDTVAARDLVAAKQWRSARRSAWMFPNRWIAQQRFQTIGLTNHLGEVMYPCLGVYTINGRTAGAYARLSRGPIVDYRAIDAAVLMQDQSGGLK